RRGCHGLPRAGRQPVRQRQRRPRRQGPAAGRPVAEVVLGLRRARADRRRRQGAVDERGVIWARKGFFGSPKAGGSCSGAPAAWKRMLSARAGASTATMTARLLRPLSSCAGTKWSATRTEDGTANG